MSNQPFDKFVEPKISNRAFDKFGEPQSKFGSSTDIRPLRMRLKHVLKNDGTRYVLYSQDNPNTIWRSFFDYEKFLVWLSVYRGVVVEKTDRYTCLEIPFVLHVHSVPRRFFNAIREPQDLVWIMRRIHPNYLARMDRFEIVRGNTGFMGKHLYCKRIFLYAKNEEVPYCVIKVVHDYLETDKGIIYI